MTLSPVVVTSFASAQGGLINGPDPRVERGVVRSAL